MKRVTIVESEDHHAEKIQKVLEGAGYVVTHVNPWTSQKPLKILTFDECIRAIEESKPDVILLAGDLRLFDSIHKPYSGRSIARQIQEVEIISTCFLPHQPDYITSGKHFGYRHRVTEHAQKLLELIG